ncbi:MAG: gliding motility protein GldC [Chitinophagaceae bacterium]|nr:MAG: gliding motility protein GldC [Chitinophagaceae bacterium]
MKKSTISIEVELNEDKIPESIFWEASDSTIVQKQKAKAILLAFWDSADKTALRMDLWTKDMMVDEMADFFYQSLITMADTYDRATQHKEGAVSMKNFAKEFYSSFREKQLKENKA